MAGGRILLTDPDGTVLRRLHAARADTVYETLARSDRPLRTACGGSTICGQCRVDVQRSSRPLPPVLPDERALLDRFAPDSPTARLACRLTVPEEGELVLSMPSADP